MKRVLIAVALGVAVGMLTVVGQKYLPTNLYFLANSGAIWLIPAFLVSYYGRGGVKMSVLTAVFCLLGCVYGYYGFEAAFNHHSFALSRIVLIWSAMALLSGGVFGLGAHLANGDRGWLSCCAMNLLPAALMAEGVSQLLHWESYLHLIPALVLRLVIALCLYFIVNRKQSIRTRNAACFTVLSAAGVLGFEILSSVLLS